MKSGIIFMKLSWNRAFPRWFSWFSSHYFHIFTSNSLALSKYFSHFVTIFSHISWHCWDFLTTRKSEICTVNQLHELGSKRFCTLDFLCISRKYFTFSRDFTFSKLFSLIKFRFLIFVHELGSKRCSPTISWHLGCDFHENNLFVTIFSQIL